MSCSQKCTSSREGDHTAGRAIARLPWPCVYHSETNGLLAAAVFNEPWGGGGRIYQHSFITIYRHLHACARSRHGERKKDLPIEIFHYESAGKTASSSWGYKKVNREQFYFLFFFSAYSYSTGESREICTRGGGRAIYDGKVASSIEYARWG